MKQKLKGNLQETQKKPEKHSWVPSFLSGDLQVYVTEQR